MKVAIIGYSGSGKSTLAARMADLYDAAVLHLDQVYWLPGWRPREIVEADQAVHSFLDTHTSWVIDGNYARMAFDRRMREADRIIFLNFSRWACLFRVWNRYRSNRGSARGDMAAGCPDKIDWEFVQWILWKGRDRAHRKRYADVLSIHGSKCVVIKNQRQLTRFYSDLTSGHSLD